MSFSAAHKNIHIGLYNIRDNFLGHCRHLSSYSNCHRQYVVSCNIYATIHVYADYGSQCNKSTVIYQYQYVSGPRTRPPMWRYSCASEMITSLLYADDIVLIAPTPEKLQLLLVSVAAWCARWRLKLNVTKTKVLHFRKNMHLGQDLLLLLVLMMILLNMQMNTIIQAST